MEYLVSPVTGEEILHPTHWTTWRHSLRQDCYLLHRITCRSRQDRATRGICGRFKCRYGGWRRRHFGPGGHQWISILFALPGGLHNWGGYQPTWGRVARGEWDWLGFTHLAGIKALIRRYDCKGGAYGRMHESCPGRPHFVLPAARSIRRIEKKRDP